MRMFGGVGAAILGFGVAIGLADAGTPAAAQETGSGGASRIIVPVTGTVPRVVLGCLADGTAFVAMVDPAPERRRGPMNVTFTVGRRSVAVPFGPAEGAAALHSRSFRSSGAALEALAAGRGQARIASADGSIRGTIDLDQHAAGLRRDAAACLGGRGQARQTAMDNFSAGRWLVSTRGGRTMALSPLTQGAVRNIGIICDPGRGLVAMIDFGAPPSGSAIYAFRSGRRHVPIAFQHGPNMAVTNVPTSTRQLVQLVMSANGPITISRDGRRVDDVATSGAAVALRQVTSACRSAGA